MSEKKSLLTAAAVYVLLGLVLIFFPDLTAGLFCTVAGLLLLLYGAITVILIDALVNLKRGLDMRALGYAGWTATLVMSAVSLALGGLILWDPFDTGLLLWRIIGAAFLYLGLSDVWSIYTLNRLVRRAQQD